MNQTTDIKTKFVFPPSAITALPILHHDLFFPVRRVLCVGQNYADHAREMGADPTREAPFFFGKPNEALLVASTLDSTIALAYPRNTELFHHEVELVIAIGKSGQDQSYDFSSPERASRHILGYALALDMTRRDVQHQLKQKSHPWEAAKAMEQSAPISPLLLAADLHTSVETTELSLLKNGHTVQSASVSQLTWNCAELLHQASRYFDLQAGDLIFTGTPAGVGSVERGDRLNARWSTTQGTDLLSLRTHVI
jgi:fumarylpyruvate hydrolase